MKNRAEYLELPVIIRTTILRQSQLQYKYYYADEGLELPDTCIHSHDDQYCGILYRILKV